jgi:hypothetical protein
LLLFLFLADGKNETTAKVAINDENSQQISATSTTTEGEKKEQMNVGKFVHFQ